MTFDSNPSVTPPARPQPLTGIKVLDMTTFLSGPFCTQILGDLGAEVLKLEPLDGDASRAIPPYFVGKDSAYYLGNNRNKRSIAINLKTTAGLEITKRLVARSDVVVENFRPGVCQRLGLHPDEIRAEQPGLIWASISGFGQQSPWSDRPAYDMIVQALSGVMSLTGEPERPSVRLGIPAGDLVAGMFAVIGILAALPDRIRTGQGRSLDVSMLDGLLSMLSYQAVYSMVGGITPKPQGSGHDSIPTYRSFTGGDGRELVVTANTERMWRDLCQVLALPELVDDTRFVDGPARLVNKYQLWPLLEDAFTHQPANVWVDRLTVAQVPAALIKTVPEALDDAKQAGRGMVVELAHRDGRRVSVLGNPVAFQGEAPPEHSFPPSLGEDTEAVLVQHLGMSVTEIERLRTLGVLMAPPQS